MIPFDNCNMGFPVNYLIVDGNDNYKTNWIKNPGHYLALTNNGIEQLS